nr:phosphotransferase [Lentzea guizhouensis]
MAFPEARRDGGADGLAGRARAAGLGTGPRAGRPAAGRGRRHVDRSATRDRGGPARHHRSRRGASCRRDAGPVAGRARHLPRRRRGRRTRRAAAPVAGPDHRLARQGTAPARDTLRRLLAGTPPGRLPTQLGHHDFRAANVLCAGTEVVAVLDFEEARFDHRVVELTRSAVLLGTRFRDWGPVPAEVHAEFRRGYESVRPLTPDEAGWWDVLLLWHALAMVPPGDDPTGWGPAALAGLSAEV